MSVTGSEGAGEAEQGTGELQQLSEGLVQPGRICIPRLQVGLKVHDSTTANRTGLSKASGAPECFL